MKLTIESTAGCVDGVGRAWIGKTENGVTFTVLICAMGTGDKGPDAEAAKAEAKSLGYQGNDVGASITEGRPAWKA